MLQLYLQLLLPSCVWREIFDDGDDGHGCPNLFDDENFRPHECYGEALKCGVLNVHDVPGDARSAIPSN